jgi:hypothetical protein
MSLESLEKTVLHLSHRIGQRSVDRIYLVSRMAEAAGLVKKSRRRISDDSNLRLVFQTSHFLPVDRDERGRAADGQQ